MTSVDTINRNDAGRGRHRPCLDSLLQGPEGLEISILDDACPPVLLEINALLRSKQPARARACLDGAACDGIMTYVTDHPWRTDIAYVAAKLLWETDRSDLAEALYRRILAQEAHPIVFAELAQRLTQNPARQAEAVTCWQRACELDPDNVDTLQAYASCVRDIGDMQKTVSLQQQAVDLAPERHTIRCQLLWGMNHLPTYDRGHLYDQARQWAQRFTRGVPCFTTFANPPVETRRLRLGVVSGNFIDNSPLTFFLPSLMAMDRTQFELFAYSNVSAQNRVADQVRDLFDVIRDIRTCSDRQAADLVRADGIDILIAFEGSCANSRLGLFARRPAPIQVDWGGLSTLALPTIDYRITDEVLDPPAAQPFHSETLLYLSGGCVTYQPPCESPAVGPLPARANEHVTFGSFNNHQKINDFTLDLWARILHRLPQSRMVFKSPGLTNPCARAFLRQRLNQRGIHAERVSMCGQTEYRDHLGLLSQVDLLLDTYPFNGSRTTLEGLWMGVPTISLCGTTNVSRTGLAIMKKLNWHTALVAQTPQAYVDRACAYAGQWEALARMRSALRGLLLSSSLCDPVQYARSLEEALRSVWQRWCQKQ